MHTIPSSAFICLVFYPHWSATSGFRFNHRGVVRVWGEKMLVHMQFKPEYFSAGFYLIITEKTQTSWDIWLSVKLKVFYRDSPKTVIYRVMKVTCVWFKPVTFVTFLTVPFFNAWIKVVVYSCVVKCESCRLKPSCLSSLLSSPLLSSVSDSDMPRAVSRPCPGSVLRQRVNGESPGNLLNFC